MREKTIKIYQFEELSEKAKDRAVEWWLDGADYPRESENTATVKAFERLAPVRINNWQYGNCSPSVDYTLDIWGYLRYSGIDAILEMSGVRLFKWLWANWKTLCEAAERFEDCPLTGYYLDCDILEPLASFLARPRAGVTLDDIMSDCLHAWVNACSADYDYQFSREAIEEAIICNEYEFTEEGRRA
jgi:hypothetical protein